MKTKNLAAAGTELLPCPFCGGKVGFDDPDAWRRGVGFCVQCPKCNLSLWSFQGQTPAAVAARWNTRGGKPRPRSASVTVPKPRRMCVACHLKPAEVPDRT